MIATSMSSCKIIHSSLSYLCRCIVTFNPEKGTKNHQKPKERYIMSTRRYCRLSIHLRISKANRNYLNAEVDIVIWQFPSILDSFSEY